MVNVEGSMRVARAAKEAGVPALIYASSVGAYSPGPKDRRVDESWPTGGTPTSYYARHKAEVERQARPLRAGGTRGPGRQDAPRARLQEGGGAGDQAALRRSIPAGRPGAAGLINLIPEIPNLRSQVIHSYDVGEAFRLAIVGDGCGARSTWPPSRSSTPKRSGRILDARPVPVPARWPRASARLSWQLRLQPVSEGWLDMAMSVPVMDIDRARTELGWTPERSADEALLDLLEGLRTGAGLDTPPLSPRTGGPLRIREILTGVGGREP